MNKSKIKGDIFEREIIHKAEAIGLKAYRNRMSRALEGEHWDISVAGRRAECKKLASGFKRIRKWLAPGTDAVICGADREAPLVMLRLDDWLKML